MTRHLSPVLLGFTQSPNDPTADLIRLFEAMEGPLLHYASSLTGNTSSAEDLVQEAFLRLQRNFASVQMPRPWLYRTVHNLAQDQLKRMSREQAATPERSTSAADDHPDAGRADEDAEMPNEAVERLEMVGLARLFINGLPPRDREVVRLKFEENLSYRAIAEHTGLTTSHVGYVLHHAVRALADEFSRMGLQR